MKWNPIWHQAISHTMLFGMVQRKNKTMVWDIPAYVDGDSLRVRFSNIYGKKPYKIGALSIYNGKDRYDVTLNGKQKFSIPTGGTTWSDEIPVSVKAGDTLQARLYYKTRAEDTNATEEGAVMYRGNHTKDRKLKPKSRAKLIANNNLMYEIPVMDQIDLGNKKDHQTKNIVVFGDSITAMNRWVKPLQKRFFETYQDEYLLLNAGISGNCLIYEVPGLLGKVFAMFGEMGTRRFERDVMDVENLDTLFFCLGTNDTSYIYNKATRKLITFENMTRAMEDCAEKAHAKGVRVVYQTISPRYGYTNVPAGPYTEEMDDLRVKLNEWAKTASCFDAIIDTASLTEDPEKPGWYREDLHQGDHLHPSAHGGQVIAGAMDLAAIVGE